MVGGRRKGDGDSTSTMERSNPVKRYIGIHGAPEAAAAVSARNAKWGEFRMGEKRAKRDV